MQQLADIRYARAQLLLDQGADAQLKTKSGKSPLELAISEGRTQCQEFIEAHLEQANGEHAGGDHAGDGAEAAEAVEDEHDPVAAAVEAATSAREAEKREAEKNKLKLAAAVAAKAKAKAEADEDDAELDAALDDSGPLDDTEVEDAPTDPVPLLPKAKAKAVDQAKASPQQASSARVR